MNALVQQDTDILGSADSISRLATAEQARILILSDTHGHYSVFESVLKEFGPSCDALLFAGDGMWDIVQYLENAQESERLLEALPPVVAFVAGNGDGDRYRVSIPANGDPADPENAPAFSLNVPQRQILRACGYGIFMVHGHRHSVDVSLEVLLDSAHAMDCDIAVYGHTHIPMAEEFSNILALNPGSPARPRGRAGPGFAIITLDSGLTTPKTDFFAVTSGFLGAYGFESLSGF